MQIAITARHGSLEPEEQAYLQQKAEKLQKYFGRLMQIEVEADHHKNSWLVEVFVSAEHKHDFVAREESVTPQAAMDLCVHKVEQQLRRYKEKVSEHRDATSMGTVAAEPPEPPEAS